MSRQGSAGNVVGAVASFFIPSLGQLVQARRAEAAMWFFGTGLAWIMGWITALSIGFLPLVLIGAGVHIYSVYEAAVWEGPGTLPGDVP